MARVTVEDCVEEIPNRFELVILAAERARRIASGVPMTVDRDNDKDPVVALREIAAKNIDPEALRDCQISSLQRNNKVDRIVEENVYAEAQEGGPEDSNHETNSEDYLFSQDIDIPQEMDNEFGDGEDAYSEGSEKPLEDL